MDLNDFSGYISQFVSENIIPNLDRIAIIVGIIILILIMLKILLPIVWENILVWIVKLSDRKDKNKNEKED